MSEASGRLAPWNSRQLLHRILDQPNLVAAVQSLPAQALGRLVAHVGLEDAGEIVALATTAQLRSIFDDDLWRSSSPGKDETFDADRFALWLEVMLEAGEDFAAAKLAELPEDLVTLAFHKQVLVINIEALAVSMSSRASENPADDDVQVEKALESCLADELDEYRIISRKHETWDTLFGLLVALDRDNHEFLQRLLERLCAMDAEFIDDSGGLCNVLTSDEALESDVGADREDRRAEQGFIAPSSAAAFLALARTSKLDDLLTSEERDPVTRAYFRHLGQPPAGQGQPPTRKPGTPAATASARAAPAADLLALLREADVLPLARTAGLLESSSPTGDKGPAEVFTAALQDLAQQDPEAHASRMRELGYLANVLAAGSSLSRRSMRAVEAAHAAVAACNLGLQRVLANTPKPPLTILRATFADKLFRVGWNLLFHDVVCATAAAAERFLARETGVNKTDLQGAPAALRSALSAGKPWLALPRLDALETRLGPPAFAAMAALLDECPSLAGELSPARKDDVDFIATTEQVKAARAFLKRALG